MAEKKVDKVENKEKKFATVGELVQFLSSLPRDHRLFVDFNQSDDEDDWYELTDNDICDIQTNSEYHTNNPTRNEKSIIIHFGRM